MKFLLLALLAGCADGQPPYRVVEDDSMPTWARPSFCVFNESSRGWRCWEPITIPNIANLRLDWLEPESLDKRRIAGLERRVKALESRNDTQIEDAWTKGWLPFVSLEDWDSGVLIQIGKTRFVTIMRKELEARAK